MPGVVCDTHSALWYMQDDRRLSRRAEFAMTETVEAGDRLYIPSICLVEIRYLVEKGRVPELGMKMLRDALSDPSFGFTVAPLDLAVADAL